MQAINALLSDLIQRKCQSHAISQKQFSPWIALFWPWQHKNLEFCYLSLVIKAISRLLLQFSCPMISLQWLNSMKDCFITLWQFNFALIFFCMNFPQERKEKNAWLLQQHQRWIIWYILMSIINNNLKNNLQQIFIHRVQQIW